MKFTSWGAARQVTGSKHLLELAGGTRVLIDCGLDYEKRNEFEDRNSTFPFSPKSIDVLILTHAHIDHSGNIPNLIKQGFSGPIFCTRPTMELSDFLLQDSLNIQRMEAMGRQKKQKKHKKHHKERHRSSNGDVQVLYSKKNIKEMMDRVICLEFEEPYRFNQELTIEFVPAGHILGAASATLTVHSGNKKCRIGFTGDLGNYDTQLVPNPQPMVGLNYLISESTYGGREHFTNATDAEAEMLKFITECCIEKGGNLIVPAFSVGRTQSIIYTIHKLFRDGKLPNVKIFTDSPLAIKSTHVYEYNLEYLNTESKAFYKKHGSLFQFPLLYVVKEEKESVLLDQIDEPCVIISAAGMVEGGRIQMHVRNNIGDQKNTILIAGYCAEGTLGHRLLQGQDFVEIDKGKRPVRADIHRTDAFSAHPDHKGLLEYLKNSDNADLREIFLVHGDESQMQILANDISFTKATLPEKGKEYILSM